jgi:hypothetical protein
LGSVLESLGQRGKCKLRDRAFDLKKSKYYLNLSRIWTQNGSQSTIYPLRRVLGLLPATFANEGVAPLDTARAISLRSAASGSSKLIDFPLFDAGAFQ